MLKELQGTPTAEFIYYCFHVLGFIAIFIFNIWYGKKRDISPKKSVITTIIVYGLTYIWIYIQFWIESGFRNFGGNNIVRGFVYIPVIAWPVAKLLKFSWKQICDFMAPCVCLCHGVSHMGCIFAGCCEGFPSTWGVYNARYDGPAVPIQPLEALTALIIFGIVVAMNIKKEYPTDGRSYPIMIILFGSTRFIWEFFRNNEKIWMGCSSLAFHALFMTLVGAIWLIYIHKQEKTVTAKRRKSGRRYKK